MVRNPSRRCRWLVFSFLPSANTLLIVASFRPSDCGIGLDTGYALVNGRITGPRHHQRPALNAVVEQLQLAESYRAFAHLSGTVKQRFISVFFFSFSPCFFVDPCSAKPTAETSVKSTADGDLISSLSMSPK